MVAKAKYGILVIIFDIGKVLIDYSFEEAFSIWATKLSVPLDYVKIQFRFDNSFVEYEKGLISSEDYFISVNSKFENKLDYETFKLGWCSIYQNKFEGIEGLLNKLHSKYRLFALTNTSELHQPVWSNILSNEMTYFEKVFCSNEIGKRKPDLNVYKYVLECINVRADAILFIDDNYYNISAAFKFGFHVIHAKNTKQIIEELSKYLLFDNI